MNWDVSPIELLEYGLPGLAVILLFMGYRLLAKEQKRPWDRASREISINTRCFMGLSASFFIGGLIIAVISPQSRIYLNIYPPEGYRPKVTLVDKEQNINENGTVRLFVKDDHFINVYNNDLLETVTSLSNERDKLRSQLREHGVEAGSNSDEAGF